MGEGTPSSLSWGRFTCPSRRGGVLGGMTSLSCLDTYVKLEKSPRTALPCPISSYSLYRYQLVLAAPGLLACSQTRDRLLSPPFSDDNAPVFREPFPILASYSFPTFYPFPPTKVPNPLVFCSQMSTLMYDQRNLDGLALGTPKTLLTSKPPVSSQDACLAILQSPHRPSLFVFDLDCECVASISYLFPPPVPP